jgi:hypothetical protein
VGEPVYIFTSSCGRLLTFGEMNWKKTKKGKEETKGKKKRGGLL